MIKLAKWNPWHGCNKISSGCENCYVYRIDSKYDKDSSLIKKNNDFNLPIKKNRQHKYKIQSGEIVYTCFTSDFLLKEADPYRIEAWKMIKIRYDLKFFFITKRIDRFLEILPSDWNDGYENVIVGCTCENQNMADYRLPIFMNSPIKSKIIICEPLLSKITLKGYLNNSIIAVVAGGESGANTRVCNYEWIQDLHSQCTTLNIPFWFKQTGSKFIKDNKLYYIPRKLQHLQAQKANINFFTNNHHSIESILLGEK